MIAILPLCSWQVARSQGATLHFRTNRRIPLEGRLSELLVGFSKTAFVPEALRHFAASLDSGALPAPQLSAHLSPGVSGSFERAQAAAQNTRFMQDPCPCEL